MLSLYRYEDDKTNYTARDRNNPTWHSEFKDEEWIQNGIKTEYRKSFSNFALMTGVDIQRNSIDNLTYETEPDTTTVGDLIEDSNVDEDVNAVYMELKNQFSSLTTTLNARYDNIKHDYKDNVDSSFNVDPSYDAFSYRVGINYKINSQHNVYASISTGFKAPTASQVSTNQGGVSSGDITSGNIDIENTYNYEIGFIGKEFGLDYGASIYQLDRKDYIGLVGGSYTWASDEDEDLYYGNVGDMRSRGFELSLNSNKEEVLSFDLAYTYLDAVFTKYSLTQVVGGGWGGAIYDTADLSGNQVPRTSKHTLNLIVDYRPIPKLTISPELLAKGSYYADEANEFKQDGYEVVNLRVNYKFTENLEIFGSIDNLFDTTYYEFVNVSSASIDKTMEDATIRVSPGREYYVGLRAKF